MSLIDNPRFAQQQRLPGKVYVVLLNWNGWHDTVECLESVSRSTYPDYQVIICDNGSKDGSLDRIKTWATGGLAAHSAPHPKVRSLTVPSIPKPISFVEYTRAVAEIGGDESAAAVRLILIQAGDNLGFSGGNNVALRFALARHDFEYVWLLNNDTVVESTALAALVRRLQEHPRAGLCGSTLLYYNAPDTVQVRGGIAYNRWFATMRPLARRQPIDSPVDRDRIERRMDYPAGASVLVTRDFLQTVGLLSESYFLYYEELDWVTRAGRRFALAYSPESIVYHKEGSSIRAADSDTPFHHADYYAHRNRLRYTRRFFPWGLPTAVLRTLGAALARLWRGQPRRAWLILRLILSKETYLFPAADRGSTG